MLERKVDGVAVLTFGEEEPVLDQLSFHDIPMVLAEFKLSEPATSTILLDYSTGIRSAVRHSPPRTQQIGFLAGPHKLHSAITRQTDFENAMQSESTSIEKSWIIECDHTLKGGVIGFGKLQALAGQPTAVICSNDMTAIGVLRAAYLRGLRVPQDLSVIGLDDIDFAEFTLPPLTTIRLSRADLARAAFEPSASMPKTPAKPACSANSSSPPTSSSAAPPPRRPFLTDDKLQNVSNRIVSDIRPQPRLHDRVFPRGGAFRPRRKAAKMKAASTPDEFPGVTSE